MADPLRFFGKAVRATDAKGNQYIRQNMSAR